jgi:hypothetical protein
MITQQETLEKLLVAVVDEFPQRLFGRSKTIVPCDKGFKTVKRGKSLEFSLDDLIDLKDVVEVIGYGKRAIVLWANQSDLLNVHGEKPHQYVDGFGLIYLLHRPQGKSPISHGKARQQLMIYQKEVETLLNQGVLKKSTYGGHLQRDPVVSLHNTIYGHLRDNLEERGLLVSNPEEKMRRIIFQKELGEIAAHLLSLRTFSDLRDIEVSEEDFDYLEQMRPKTYDECKDIPKPCPFFSCPYNLVVDPDTRFVRDSNDLQSPGERTSPRNKFIVYHEDVRWDDSENNCVLSHVESDGEILNSVAAILNITYSRVMQLEAEILQKVRDGLGVSVTSEDLLNLSKLIYLKSHQDS